MSEVHADVVLRGGVVFVAGHRELADGVAPFGNRVLATGDGRAMEAMIGPRTRVVDLAHDLHAELAG